MLSNPLLITFAIVECGMGTYKFPIPVPKIIRSSMALEHWEGPEPNIQTLDQLMSVQHTSQNSRLQSFYELYFCDFDCCERSLSGRRS